MSHLSQIKTSIYDLQILITTLTNLGFQYRLPVKDQANNFMYTEVDLLVFSDDQMLNPIFGFIHDGEKYILVTDVYFWKLDMSLDSFVDKLTQAYALNVILNEAENSGFDTISQVDKLDGSIELIVQKWCS